MVDVFLLLLLVTIGDNSWTVTQHPDHPHHRTPCTDDLKSFDIERGLPWQKGTDLDITGTPGTFLQSTAWFTSTTSSRPGPKSGRTMQHRSSDFDTTDLTTDLQDDTHRYGGEGYLPWSWRKISTGFDAESLKYLFPVKIQDTKPPMGFGLKCRPEKSTAMRCTVKRSFHRACKRASLDGYAWYKGQQIPFDAFPEHMQRSQLQRNQEMPMHSKKSVKTEPTRVSPLHRYNVMHVNIGGLSSMRYEELQHWALQKEIDFLVVSETRWSFTSEWCTSKWNCIHSGTHTDISDGLLIMSRTHICPADKIGITEYIPGRLVHIRYHLHARSFDLVSCYQYVDNRKTVQKLNRHTFWLTLIQCLTTIPNRNSLLLAGDFNCTLTQEGHHVGTSDFRWMNCRQRGRQHGDAEQMHAILRRFDLTVLNSWNAQSPPTYCNGLQASRIDYFIMRHADSDGFSKQIMYHMNADFLPEKGAMHFPMTCTIKKIPYAFTRAARQSTCSYRQRLQCRTAWRLKHDSWHQMVHSVHVQLEQFLNTPHSDSHFIDDLHQQLMPCFQTYFPKQMINPVPDSNTEVIESKWHHRRQMLQPTMPTLNALFHTWFHFMKFHTLKRKHQKHIKTLKQMHLQDLIQEVDQAAQTHDSFKVYNIISRYTPKQPKKKIRLRSETGAPASSQEVKSLTQEFIQKQWAGPDRLQMAHVPFGEIPFDVAELAQEIAKTPAVKSVAPPFLPGIIWKQISWDIACILFQQLTKWWTKDHIFVPSQWRHAWVTFLPKPNKQPSCLENLRAIALMEPLGKNVLGIITKKLKHAIHETIVKWPQFAYVEFRSAHDAIRRVSQHCVDTRWLLRNQQRNVHQRAAQMPTFTVCGGIQLFLDIHRAFDAIPRKPLFDHLRSMHINQDLVSILGSWHDDTAYITQHDQVFVETATHCGIRQGCRAAPILWTIFTDLLFEAMSRQIDSDWLKRAVTLFADDIHSGAIFKSERELTQTIQKFGILLDVIEMHGLTISLHKSMVLIAFGGTNFRKIQQRIIQKDDKGCYILVPRANGSHSRLPVQKTARYLGVQMSYQMPEKLTLQHRLKSARLAFFRLKKWLRAKGIRLDTRLHLWKSCIYSTLVYGLLANNITLTGVQQIHTFIMSTLRQTVGNYSHLTGMTHAQFLQHHGIQHPFEQLLQTIAQQQHMHRQRLNKLLPHDILHTVDWSNLPSLTELICAAWDALDPNMDTVMPAEVEEVPQPIYTCQRCSLRFTSLPNLRRHQTHVHGQQQLRTFSVTVASHAQHGLPICMHCHKTFSTWRRMTIHLERNCCQAMTPTTSSTSRQATADKAMTLPDLSLLLSKPYGHSLIQAVTHSQWFSLRSMSQAHADLRHHCILCGMYYGRVQELNMHIRTRHGHFAANVHAKAAQFGRSQASITPCFYCEKQFLRHHQCAFWTQIALLLVNLPSTGTDACPDVVLRCEICTRQYDDLQALHNHLFSDHKVEIHDFQPNRDLLAAEPVCGHCFSCFADRSAVRQHITRGQCPAFDAAKPIEEMPVAQHWQDIIQTGDLRSLMQSPMQRLSMTLHCQLCGIRFERQQDLAQHLQFVHADKWTQAQPMTQLLLQIGHIEQPCICNPQTHSRGASHVCLAYRQLSMLALRVDHDLFLPWTFDQAQTRSFLAGTHHHAAVESILSALETRQFTELWMHPGICHLLSHTCLICGGDFHPAVLSEHVKAMHPANCRWIPTILPQLLPVFLQTMTNDFQCQTCELVFNLPNTAELTPEQRQQRTQLVQIHAQHHCPVVYQIGLLLTHGLTDTRREPRPSDDGCRSSGSLQGHGSHAPERQVHPRSGARKRYKKAQTDACPGSTEASAGGDQTGETHGQHAAEVGCRTSTDEKARLFRLFSANRATCTTPTTAGTGQGMACTDETSDTGDSDNLCPAAHGSLPGSGNVDGGQSVEALPSRQTGPTMGDSHLTRGPDGGRAFPISEVESAPEGPDPHQAGSNHDAQNAEVHGTTEGHLPGSQCSSEVPCAEAHRYQWTHPMDPPDRDETRRGPDPPGSTAGLHSLGPDWSHDEGAHAGGQSPESGAATTSGERTWQTDPLSGEIQGQGQALEEETAADLRWMLRQRLTEMQLINLENWCYANTALVTLLWALLSCTDIPVADWGPLGQHIVQFIQFDTLLSVHLPDVWWFQQILQSWHGDGVQCDPVEFLTHLVKGLGIPRLNWSWERRVQLGTEISVRDQGDIFTPITLYIDPEQSHAGWIRLDTLIQSWHNYMGMQTALLQDTPLVCLHIDRNIMSGDGHPCKSDHLVGLHGVFSMPCYQGDGLAITWQDYRVISVITHLGTDQAGHCRAALRVNEEPECAAGPYMQLITNDNVAPSRHWHEPTWFLQNIMCVWMCKLSAIDMHKCADGPTSHPVTTRSDSSASMMQFLQQFAWCWHTKVQRCATTPMHPAPSWLIPADPTCPSEAPMWPPRTQKKKKTGTRGGMAHSTTAPRKKKKKKKKKWH